MSFLPTFKNFIQHYLKKDFRHKFSFFNEFTKPHPVSPSPSLPPNPHPINGQNQLCVTRVSCWCSLRALVGPFLSWKILWYSQNFQWIQNSIFPNGRKRIFSYSLINSWNLSKWNISFIILCLNLGFLNIALPYYFIFTISLISHLM